jgi:hypothetical protein
MVPKQENIEEEIQKLEQQEKVDKDELLDLLTQLTELAESEYHGHSEDSAEDYPTVKLLP